MRGTSQLPPDYCGPCYGAADGCCNTCDAVKAAYQRKKWGIPADDELEQCKREEKERAFTRQDGEGCNLYGTLEVNRVSGNFHIAPGSSAKHTAGGQEHQQHEFSHNDVSHF